MSKREFDRLEVLTGMRAGRLRVADACTLLGLSRRQLLRLLKGMREAGAVSLASKRRGRPSNRRPPAAVRELALALVRAHYADIDIFCADTPQAKGRVERAFGTLQDRLVKELHLAGLSTPEAANAWLPGFMADYNGRFGREPANVKDLHRPLSARDDVDEALAWREPRMVTANLTLRYDRMMLLLDPTPRARALARKQVEVRRFRFAKRRGELPGWAVRGAA